MTTTATTNRATCECGRRIATRAEKLADIAHHFQRLAVIYAERGDAPLMLVATDGRRVASHAARTEA